MSKKRKPCKLADGRDNLRGWKALVDVDDAPRLVRVLTHIRDGFWMVEGRTLPCQRAR